MPKPFPNYSPEIEGVESHNSVILQWQRQLSATALLVVDVESQRVVDTNQSALRLLGGGDSASLLGHQVQDFFPRGELEFLFDAKTAVLTSVMIEAQASRKGQGAFFCQVQGSKLEEGGQKLLILAITDLTAQKKLRRDLEAKQEGLRQSLKELVQKNEELLALDKAKDKFLALVAHELRTPLNTVVSTSELIQGGYVEGQELTELLNNLSSQSKFLLDLVNDILDLTKVQSGKMDYFVEWANPLEVASHQASIFAEMAEKNQVKIEVYPASTDVNCHFDPLRLEQILGNLISNAVKFNRPQGLVELRAEREGEFVCLSVKDSGLGIAPDQIGKIFDEFETVGKISHHHKGTGLGLSIVKALVEGQGGKIEVTSQQGVGTEFKIWIPCEKVLPEEFYRTRNSDGVILF